MIVYLKKYQNLFCSYFQQQSNFIKKYFVWLSPPKLSIQQEPYQQLNEEPSGFPKQSQWSDLKKPCLWHGIYVFIIQKGIKCCIWILVIVLNSKMSCIIMSQPWKKLVLTAQTSRNRFLRVVMCLYPNSYIIIVLA